MFRDGQYLEVIKAPNDCLATAVVTVQERTVEIKNQKVITNKWLQVEDWAALYKILERAVLRNGRQDDGSHREGQGCEWRKSTRQLEVTYTFEHPENASGLPSLPTIKVHVSPARKKPVKREPDNETSKRSKVKTKDDATKRTKEEKSSVQTLTKIDRLKKTPKKSAQTTPKKTETPSATAKEPKGLKRKKSALENMRLTLNEYTPTLCEGKSLVPENVSYVPNSVKKLETNYEIYEPCATTVIPDSVFEEYVPNSKGLNPSIEEYEPDFKFPSKLMKFDDSYVPSSVRRSVPNDSKKTPSKQEKSKLQKLEARRKRAVDKKKMILFS
ncbi:uncharacterized protein [Mycetomoellerius zeteki]|uniref:uncharacterized protein n=1 Tax=Mycetomoellerius zeteki TaxID=64791 RepID=UPI00084ED02C|nr:PREDICTED: uncharacterized protein LOC108722359 [Trachymyrmex zeteki]